MDTIQLTPDDKQNCQLTFKWCFLSGRYSEIVQNHTEFVVDGSHLLGDMLYLLLVDIVPFCLDAYTCRGI